MLKTAPAKKRTISSYPITFLGSSSRRTSLPNGPNNNGSTPTPSSSKHTKVSSATVGNSKDSKYSPPLGQAPAAAHSITQQEVAALTATTSEKIINLPTSVTSSSEAPWKSAPSPHLKPRFELAESKASDNIHTTSDALITKLKDHILQLDRLILADKESTLPPFYLSSLITDRTTLNIMLHEVRKNKELISGAYTPDNEQSEEISTAVNEIMRSAQVTTLALNRGRNEAIQLSLFTFILSQRNYLKTINMPSEPDSYSFSYCTTARIPLISGTLRF